MPTAIPGMFGTGDWATGQRPQSWREAILYQYPNGDMPLTAIMAKTKSKQITDVIHNWFEKTLPLQGVTITATYTNAALSAAATGASAAGTIFYVKMAEADAKNFRKGHMVLFRDSDYPAVDFAAEVLSNYLNGASSYVCVKTLEADNNVGSGASYNVTTCDYLQIVSSIQAQGSSIPTAVAYNPDPKSNYTSIVETSLYLTRTAKRTRLRTKDQYTEAKRECLELHGIMLERTMWHSVLYSGTGDNGQPKTALKGILPAVYGTANADATYNVSDYRYSSTYAGQSWKDAGEDWLDEQLEIAGRYGAPVKMAFCGSGAAQGIAQLAKTNGNIQLTPVREGVYGLHIRKWEHPSLTLLMKTHPLWNVSPADRYKMVIVPIENLTYCYIDDTFYKKDKAEQEGGISSQDATLESYLTEFTLEYSFLNEFYILDGVGRNNVYVA